MAKEVMMAQSCVLTARLLLGLLLAIGGACQRSTIANAREMPIVAPPTAFALAGPDKLTGPVKLDLYARTGPRPNWFIGQWATAGGKLPPFERIAGPNGAVEFVSRSRAASVSIAQHGAALSYVLSQNGPSQPCTTAAGRPHEFDLFANTGGPQMNPALDSAVATATQGAKPPTLAQMTRLDQHVVVEVAGAAATETGKHCKINQGNVLTAITLVNDRAKPTQVLFYQLSLYVVCGGVERASCERNLSKPFFWWTDEDGRDHAGRVTVRSFGYDQRLPQLGRPLLRIGAHQTLDIDLLPDVLRLIAEGAHGIDTDAAHWRVSGAYHGQSVWGDVSMRTTWSDYRLTAEFP
jgi:hypothetical protein